MKGRILIVDDEETARKSLSDILKLEGYSVVAKGDGQSALDALSEDEFDLMLLDIKMPGMSGLEVLEKSTDIAKDCKIVLLTAHGSMESAIEAVRHGAHDYLLKPASPNDILATVEKAMNVRIETQRKRRLLDQMEASIQELKDAEGVETTPTALRSVYSLGDEVKVDLERREILLGDKIISLTPTEGKLMKVLLENRGRVLSHRELVLMVQGYQTTDWEAPEIMRPLVSRLRRKLSRFENGSEWIVNVRGTGYVFDRE
jgi:DNA-binding response OmpR family regulator